MRLFRRRRGRHDLGGAVRDIPAAAPVVATAVEPGQEHPRVQLGFRDGTTAALAPDSPQARALVALAGVLTRRE